MPTTLVAADWNAAAVYFNPTATVIDTSTDDGKTNGLENNILIGSEVSEELSGGAGNDVLVAGAHVAHPASPVSLPIDGIEQLNGGSGDDLLLGGAGSQQMFGDEDNDTLHGGADHDYLNGGAGADILDGGDGADTIWGGAGNDTIVPAERLFSD